MKTRTPASAVVLLATATIVLTGCAAAASTPHRSASHQGAASRTVTRDGSTVTAGSSDVAPSEAAKMICTDETRGNIATVLAVPLDRKPTSTWTGGTYTCTYRLPTGTIVLSVHESADAGTAATYTGGLRHAMPRATNLTGLTQTAFGTSDGVVVLQKDNDTLRVDTSGLSPQSGELYKHRNSFAYEIAATIMGCWTGG